MRPTASVDQPGGLHDHRRGNDHLVPARPQQRRGSLVPAVGVVRHRDQDPGVNDDHDALRGCSARISECDSARSGRPSPMPTKDNSGIVSPVAQLVSASTTAVSTLTPRDIAAASRRRARSSGTFSVKVTATDSNAPHRPCSALVRPSRLLCAVSCWRSDAESRRMTLLCCAPGVHLATMKAPPKRGLTVSELVVHGVETRGIEPLTSTLQRWRSAN